MAENAFDKVRAQVGACGIWCGSCAVGNGAFTELSQRFEGLLRAYGFDHWGTEELDFGRLVQGLTSCQRVSECPGCRQGGGRDSCELRACAVAKGLSGCAQCPEMAGCKHIHLLQHMRSGALAAGLVVHTENVEAAPLMEQWTAGLAARWPCCILFEHGR